MIESTLTGLKIIVERAVRPVRAGIARKRKMREELLAHVVGVFEEEVARLGDERAALQQTALRFGNPLR
jgi:ATP-dependent Clp protease ATP-binding subunit ClpC